MNSETFVFASNFDDLGELEDTFNAAKKYAEKIGGKVQTVTSLQKDKKTIDIAFNVIKADEKGNKSTKAIFKAKTNIKVDTDKNTISTSGVK